MLLKIKFLAAAPHGNRRILFASQPAPLPCSLRYSMLPVLKLQWQWIVSTINTSGAVRWYSLVCRTSWKLFSLRPYQWYHARNADTPKYDFSGELFKVFLLLCNVLLSCLYKVNWNCKMLLNVKSLLFSMLPFIFQNFHSYWYYSSYTLLELAFAPLLSFTTYEQSIQRRWYNTLLICHIYLILAHTPSYTSRYTLFIPFFSFWRIRLIRTSHLNTLKIFNPGIFIRHNIQCYRNNQQKEPILSFWRIRLQPPLVTGHTGLHDNATSADACRWGGVTNPIRIHVKWTYLWKIIKKIRNWIIGLKFFPLESENSLLHVKKKKLFKKKFPTTVQICRLENIEHKSMKQVSYGGKYSLSASRAHQSHL